MVYVDERGLRWNFGSYKNWLEDHNNHLERYLFDNWDEFSRKEVSIEFTTDPILAKNVIEDFITNSEDLKIIKDKTIKFMTAPGHEIVAISGSKGSGKTSTIVSLIEEIKKKTGAQPAFIGQPNKELEKHGWEWRIGIKDVQKDDALNVQESGVFLQSRRSMKEQNIAMISVLPILRHREVKSVMFDTQTTAQSDVGILRHASVHIIKDYADAYGMKVERDMITDDRLLWYLYPREGYIFKDSNIKAWSFVRKKNGCADMFLEEVSWYNDKISKSYGNFTTEAEAMGFAAEMVEQGADIGIIKNTMSVRGFDRKMGWWTGFAEDVMSGGVIPAHDMRASDSEAVKGLLDDNERLNYINKFSKNKKGLGANI